VKHYTSRVDDCDSVDTRVYKRQYTGANAWRDNYSVCGYYPTAEQVALIAGSLSDLGIR